MTVGVGLSEKRAAILRSVADLGGRDITSAQIETRIDWTRGIIGDEMTGLAVDGLLTLAAVNKRVRRFSITDAGRAALDAINRGKPTNPEPPHADR